MTDGSTTPQEGLPVRAIEGNLFAFFSLLRKWSKVEIHDEPELLWSISDIPYPLFNSVLRADLAPGPAEAAIDEALHRCRARHVPMLWWTSPSTRPADLSARLSARGFVAETARGMALSLKDLGKAPAGPEGLTVDRVTNLETMAEWCQVLCEGFEMPRLVGDAMLDLSRALGLGPDQPLRYYLGRLDGDPVAISSVFLNARVAGIHNVTTLSRARRKGVGSVLTYAPLQDAQAEGCQRAILHASEMVTGVYRSLGFEEHCPIGQHVWAGDAESTSRPTS